MKIRKSLYLSENFHPAENLGLEDYLISACEKDEVILYLWQNRRTVVIGKHQNPYKECNIANLEEDGIHLVRRRSGGGAVFHDMGNLNFTFIAPTELYDQDKHFSVILEALKPWGINALQTGRNDITVDGKKFSGNAFSHKKNISCHHGTLLVDVDMKELGRYLTPPQIKLVSKGIDSVRARVVNLKDLNAELNIDTLKNSLIEAFDTVYEGKLTAKDTPLYSDLTPYSDPYKNWDWTMAKSPQASLSYAMKFAWGTLVMDLSVSKGIITSCVISSDSLEDLPFNELQEALPGVELKVAGIQSRVDQLFSSPEIKTDLNEFIKAFVQAG